MPVSESSKCPGHLSSVLWGSWVHTERPLRKLPLAHSDAGVWFGSVKGHFKGLDQMPASLEFLSSAWILGIPREQLLSRRQNVPKSLGARRYLHAAPACLLHTPQVKQQEETAPFTAGLKSPRVSPWFIVSVKGTDQ